MKETLVGSGWSAIGLLFCVLTSSVRAEEAEVVRVVSGTAAALTNAVDVSEVPPPDGTELNAILGKWEREVKTKGGIVRIVKEHDKDSTTLTISDRQDNVLSSKISKFRLETKGKVRIFTFYDNLVVAGPQKGQAKKQPQSYIYRVMDDKFYEVRGMLVDEAEDPAVFVWRRVK